MSICMYDIPFDRSILQLSNGIRYVMSSTDRKLELTAKASMAQPVSQPAVCSNWLRRCATSRKVPGSIPGLVTGDFFRGILQVHVPGVETAFRNEYHDIPGGKDGRCVRLTTLPH
jgi:hypothetical protein